jgi:malate dehydrogenase
MKRAKITIVGAGNVGASCAVWAAQKELGDVALIDIPEFADKTAGKALDLLQCAPIERFDCKIVGTADYAHAKESDVVVITAGIPRKPGMSRDGRPRMMPEVLWSCG